MYTEGGTSTPRERSRANTLVMAGTPSPMASSSSPWANTSSGGPENGTVPFSGPPEDVFAHGDELEGMGLGVPAMTKVFARLRSLGVDVPASVYTVPQAREAVLAALHRKGVR